MERKNIVITLIVIALVLGFITELFYFGGSFRLTMPWEATASGVNNVTGTAIFNGTIRTYTPALQIPANTSQSVIDRLRKMDGVKDVQVQANNVIIETETRDDVYPVAVALRQMNVTGALTVANIAMPQDLEVVTDNGTINASTMGFSGIVQVVTEPFVDSGSEVPVSLTAVVSEGMLIDYSSARVLVERNSMTVNATVAELGSMTFTYMIPWEGRSGIDLGRLNGSGYSYAYKEVNTILFSPQLNITDVLLKKQLPYISYIDTASAEVSPDFTDMGAIGKDFAGTNVTFRPSTLTVTGNATPALMGLGGAALDYAPAIRYAYVLGLPASAGGYDLGNATSFTMETSAPLEINSTVPLNVTVLAMGTNVLSVTTGPLP